MGAGCGPNLDPELSESRGNLAATTVTCPNGNQQALFGGGFGRAISGEQRVDIFDGGDSLERSIDSLTLARSRLAASSVQCNDKGYALFGGGSTSVGFVNDVDVFECNDDGISFKERLELSVARDRLAATSVQCNDKGYALFGGGFDNTGPSFFNDVDVFECNDDGISFKERLELSVARSNLAATSVTAPDGKQYALFGGGFENTGVTDTVDIFHCNDNGVFYTKTANFNTGPPRFALAATTVNCGGVDYGLFGGGSDGTGPVFNDIDIFDSSSLEFI